MQVIACHPSQVEAMANVLAKAQAQGPSYGKFVAVDGYCVKGAEWIEDVVGDETLDAFVAEVREVAR